MNKGKKTLEWKAIANIKIYQVGVFVFLLVLIFGYLDFRIQGDGIYNDGQSSFASLPKGMDFKAAYTYAVSLRLSFDEYISQNSTYPPIVTIAYLPLSFFPLNIAYKYFCIILICFLYAIVYSLLGHKGYFHNEGKKNFTNKAILSLLIVYVLFQTYPVNFAFERGNYDIIAISFAVFSLLAMTRKHIILSAILLAISTQLKIYPAILIIILFARFGWKSILYFVLFNGILLLSLGIAGLESFVSILFKFTSSPFIWDGNHSLVSFFYSLKPYLSGILETIKSHKSMFLGVSLIPFAGIFSLLILRYLRFTKGLRNNKGNTSGIIYFSGIEIGVIGTCFCLMSLLPTTSHDYKLVIQIIPLMLLLSCSWYELFNSKKTAYIVSIIISASIAYLFIPRFSILPFRLLGINSSATEMKTPALLIAFLGYVYLALKGNLKLMYNIEDQNNSLE